MSMKRMMTGTVASRVDANRYCHSIMLKEENWVMPTVMGLFVWVEISTVETVYSFYTLRDHFPAYSIQDSFQSKLHPDRVVIRADKTIIQGFNRFGFYIRRDNESVNEIKLKAMFFSSGQGAIQ